jgi:catechol 2,3-dioxygenase-like lactoylglutathione lyase family enzyme
MKVLRHEEFSEGCKAACNGPYDGMWSKSMVGYGPEDNHFVVELTYNYGIKSYRKGNDYQFITIHSRHAFSNALQYGYDKGSDGCIKVQAPGGYDFLLYNTDTGTSDPVQSICLSVTNLDRSIKYWHSLLGLTVYSQSDDSVVLGYDTNQAKLVLKQISGPIDRGEAFGRIAFSCPKSELPVIEKAIKEANETILTPLVSLDTPGKATVEVVILADPDGHEICFVGDEGFRELSRVDPKADELIDEVGYNLVVI